MSDDSANGYWEKLNNVASVMESVSDSRVFLTDGLLSWKRNFGFLNDKDFVRCAQNHATSAHIPNYYWQLHTVCWAVKNCLRVPGDFVELGVYKGYTTAIVAEYIDFANIGRTWYLYDTFEGIPEDQLNKGWTNSPYEDDEPDGVFAEVTAQFEPYENIRVIRGRVPEVLDEAAPETIAFMHIDLNSAKAECAALEVLYDRLSTGGMIVFDDYGWSACIEQQVGIDEFMAARGVQVLEIPTGQGIFVKNG